MSEKAEKNGQPKGSIAGRAMWLAFLTIISRLLGLARDVAMAWRFGAGMQADAFNFAFLIPNLLRRLLAEGAISVALVPVFGEVNKEKGREELERLYRAAFGVYSAALLGFIALLIGLTPYVVPHLVYGFTSEKQELTVRLTQVMLPFIFFLAIASVSAAMLHTYRLFTVPALAPIALNLIMLGGILFLTGYFDFPIYGVALSVSFAGFVIMLMQVWRLKRMGVPIVPLFKWEPALGEMLRLMGPATVGVMVYYLNVLFSKFLASFLEEGSITYLYYSDRLFELPLGVIAVSVATVTLPELSALTGKEDLARFRQTLISGVRLSLYVCVPAAMGLFVLREDIIALLFRHGKFSEQDAAITAAVFLNALPGLVFVSAIRVLVQSFYSLKKPIFAVYIAAAAFAVNAMASLVFIRPFGAAGLTLANSLSSFFNVCLTLFILSGLLVKLGAPKMPKAEIKALVKDLAFMCLSAAIMGAAVFFALGYAREYMGYAFAGRAIYTAALTAFGGAIYYGGSRIFSVEEAGKLENKIRARFKK